MSKTAFYTALYQSPLGMLKLEGNDTALTRLCFINDDVATSPYSGGGILRMACEQLDGYFDGSRIQFDLPLELDGTEFQKVVWLAALTIPYKTTCSYRELAERIGRPKAFRAVANALGRNPIPLIIPCHRVIRCCGALGGYGGNGGNGGNGGGVWRKEWLLSHEKTASR